MGFLERLMLKGYAYLSEVDMEIGCRLTQDAKLLQAVDEIAGIGKNLSAVSSGNSGAIHGAYVYSSMRPEVGFGERKMPSASLPDETLKGGEMRGLLASPAHQTLPRDCYEPTWYRPLGPTWYLSHSP
ncbi:MAG: hypothetical protein FWF88_13665 [Peptococcaceae bacterium]|nr:hypothetical protein [Peptococcaceae bacterium]